MEIKGDDFLKKIQKHQEREELEQKLNELNNSNNQVHETNEIDDNSNRQTFEEVTNMTRQRESMNKNQNSDDQELDNIMLQSGTTNENNKKKYLALGLVLVVLFLLTIIIIRLLSDDPKEDPFTQENNTGTKQEDKNIEQNFQKIMNDRVKKNSSNEQMVSEEKINQVKEDVTNPSNNEQAKPSQLEDNLDKTIERIKEEKRKEIEAKKQTEERNEAAKQEQKETKKSVQSLMKDASSSKPKGYFVQIGAFTKTPSQSYIQNIRDNNLKYKIYRVDVKGTMYNKVLIGPYSSRASAEGQIPDIKKKLNLSGAYVLKF